MNKFLSILLTICFIVFYGCEPKANSQLDKDAKAEAEVAILAVNDIHADIDMFAQFAAVVDSLRGVYPDLLVFSAGDNRTGNPVNDQFDPVSFPVIELMNKVGFDASAVGNHEWDGNVVNLQNNIEQANFPFLCANVFIPNSLNLDVKPYSVIENQGVKIAVVGMIELRHDGIPGAHPKNLTEVSFKQAAEVIPDYQYLRNENEIMILLSHCGYEDDMELAQTNPYLDAIIGGHTHTLVENPHEVNGVLVSQSGSHLEYATLHLFKVKDGKVVEKSAKVLNVKDSKKKNQEVKKMVDDFNDAPSLNEAIATAKTKFNNREELGCMMTDAMRVVSGADFAFQNTGGVRVNYLKKGPITVKDVYMIDPFNNEIVVYTMTGAQVEKFIINSYRKNGRFPSHVSGMRYEVVENGRDLKANIHLDKGNFSKKATYKVAMNSYMASTVNIESLDEGQSQFMTSEEMMIEFLRKQKTVDYQGVSRVK